MSDTHSINPFIDQLLHDLRLDQLPEPKRTDLLNKITALAERRVLQTVVMNMDEGAINEFEQKLQSGMAEDQAVQFMMEKVPGLAAKIEAALHDLYQELVADMEKIDEKLKSPSAEGPSTALVMPAQDVNLTPASRPPLSNQSPPPSPES